MLLYRKGTISLRLIVTILILTLLASFISFELLSSKVSLAESLGLPQPNSILKLSETKSLAKLIGLKFDQSEPMKLEFLIDKGNSESVAELQVSKMLELFLAALAVPTEDLWVNFSPYEEDRIISAKLAETELGKVLLAQDYILKQLSASLTSPDTALGKEYWENDLLSSIDDNKIWITPEVAELYSKDNLSIIKNLNLDVLSEDAYINKTLDTNNSAKRKLLSEIKTEVNSGHNFAQLRQACAAVLLANWYKAKVKDIAWASYCDSNNIEGVDNVDPKLKEQIYSLYMQSFNKGVYDIIKHTKTNDALKQKTRYFSGGCVLNFDNIVSSSIEAPVLNPNDIYSTEVNFEFNLNDDLFKKIKKDKFGPTEKWLISFAQAYPYSKKLIARLIEMRHLEESPYVMNDFLEKIDPKTTNVPFLRYSPSKLKTLNEWPSLLMLMRSFTYSELVQALDVDESNYKLKIFGKSKFSSRYLCLDYILARYVNKTISVAPHDIARWVNADEKVISVMAINSRLKKAEFNFDINREYRVVEFFDLLYKINPQKLEKMTFLNFHTDFSIEENKAKVLLGEERMAILGSDPNKETKKDRDLRLLLLDAWGQANKNLDIRELEPSKRFQIAAVGRVLKLEDGYSYSHLQRIAREYEIIKVSNNIQKFVYDVNKSTQQGGLEERVLQNCPELKVLINHIESVTWDWAGLNGQKLDKYITYIDLKDFMALKTAAELSGDNSENVARKKKINGGIDLDGLGIKYRESDEDLSYGGLELKGISYNIDLLHKVQDQSEIDEFLN